MTVPLHSAIKQLARLRQQQGGTLYGSTVLQAIIATPAGADNLINVLPDTPSIAAVGDADDSRAPMTYAQLQQQIQQLQLNT